MSSIIQNTTTDLQLAVYSPRTVEAYSYHVKKFLEHFNKEPKFISEDEIKQYFLFLKYKKKLSGSASAQAPGAQVANKNRANTPVHTHRMLKILNTRIIRGTGSLNRDP